MNMETNQSDVEQAMISKIEALLRQANHPNTGQPEREAFQAKALALMTKHRIESVEWDVDANEEPADYEYGWCRGSYAKAHQLIIQAIGKVYGCRVWAYSSGKPGNPARHVYVFGFKGDAQRVKMLAAQFVSDAVSQAASFTSSGHGASDRTTNWRKSFMMGYATDVGKRYEEAKRLLDQEQPGWATMGSALVLVSRQERVDLGYASKGKMRKSSRGQGFNPAGFMAGQEAGRNSNIGRGRIGNTPKKAIG